MNSRLILLAMPVALLLAGCAINQKAPGASSTFDRIGQEMQSAVGARSKGMDEALSQAMLPPLQLDLPDSAKNVEPRFDLALVNAPASQVFMALVSNTPYSMLVSPEVSGNVTVRLKNVTVREALETLRELYGYEFKFQGTRIYIQPNTIQTRIFRINYLAGKRQGQSDLRVISSSVATNQPQNTGSSYPTTASPAPVVPAGTSATGSGSTPPSSHISTTQTSDFWHDLTNALTSMVGSQDGRAVIVSPGSGVVLVKAFPAEIRSVENFLRITQLIVERQVMLEAKIIEVELNQEFQSGVNWNHFGGSNNRFAYGAVQPGTVLNTPNRAGFDASNVVQNGVGAIFGNGVGILPGAGGIAATTRLGNGFFGLAFQSANFAALLNFLETQGNVQVLSSPRIASINNQKAVLKVGIDEFFVTNVSSTVTSTGNSNVTTPNITLQPFFSGIALDVTPQIDGENNIVLHIHPSISLVKEKQKVIDLGTLGVFTLPLANSAVNETDSVVRVQDGNIVAIGGLMKQEQVSDANGFPGTTTSSTWGLLFGTRDSHLRKRELVILIKPTIIRNDSGWKDDLIETQGRIQQLDPRLARPQAGQ
ncbi:MAG TPA: secretin N-terminal domain-containing protein [Accumulibacter sp.]|uniref:Pectic enzymes secretion protein OutD n=3 Tax=Candidatus Accumulibacter TaxID=327159 RepID=A0A080M934_9PROT|nr:MULTISPECIES: secretin N-terminal domain-containing protein [Candidatus Accumulibacter]KFB76980.1 MAG: Pectic enzymes secretion protein OutD [Candidatus Accumulibacter cognatus]MCC2869322.1 secretin N-terminal domain-containing protein [Candidatus Accumulibacter phosphatis]MCM8579656.1 secretin N-terminal domain-containing protein [Accumulibacter sp.]MCM8623369.1 secretin N-terminal domain-containing protein [Accumulibacter sp.]MCQ1549869.1 secretin N-terminal domain-containing protein [Can